jgi:imidazole glycerol-phosphate synthase subunit HisH
MQSPSITIVDYQLGNLFSVKKACEVLGSSASISSEASVIASADALILPGVGAFGQAMENLQRLDLVAPILDHVAAGKPLFGICLGLQLLFEESEEFGNPKGLGILNGCVKKLPVTESPVPQIGWNQIEPSPSRREGWSNSPLTQTKPGAWMYFVHSFYVHSAHEEDELCTTHYSGFSYTSAVLKGTVFATQFHPEKSSHEGLEIYRNWLASVSNHQSY